MIGMEILDSNHTMAPSHVSWKEIERKNTEPISVLDTRRSPSPSTSTSTLSGFLASASIEFAGADDWEALLSEAIQNDTYISSTVSHPLSLPQSISNPASQISNLGTQSVNFRNYSDQIVDENPQFFNPFPPNLQNPTLWKFGNLENFSSNLQMSKLDTQLQTLVHHQPPLKRPNLGNLEEFSSIPQILKLDTQSQTLFQHQPPLKRPNVGNFGNLENISSNPHISKYDTQLPSPLEFQTLVPHQDHHQPLAGPNSGNLGNYVSDPRILELDKHPPETLPQQVVYDQLYKASELIVSGNLSNAHSILARLNHQLTPGTKPFQRASFYLKEALTSAFSDLFCETLTPLDGLFKMGAFKLFSEVSPLSHFINFTSNQAILEAVRGSERVHVIDFDIGSGAQWASFMAELPISNASLCLKITAFASPLTHHPFELGLMHESLTQFANEIGLVFELEVINLDSFDLSAYPVHLFKSSDREMALAVNFPIWAFSNRLSALPSLIRFVKQLSPKIVVSMERGCERTDLPLSHHLLHILQYYEALLDSIDASNANLETVSKIEKFIVQPKIENIVLGRLNYPNQMPHWRALFAAAGFLQINLSNFNETQAECVVAKTQVRGFHVKKRESSLVLRWLNQELVSASAWRCRGDENSTSMKIGTI